jgi:aryl-alcohol dehydrogenase-like predicted oxidoreductase
VSVIGLGLGPMGLANYSRAELQAVVQAAFDEGVTYFDMQPDYGNAEAYLAPWLRNHRDRVFLVTKTWAKAGKAALASIQQSVRRLNVDHVDAVLVNNIGDYDVQRLFAAGIARRYRPLDGRELDALLKRGRTLAVEWGPRFGRV